MYTSAIIGLGQIAYAIDNDPLRLGIWSHYNTYLYTDNINLLSVCDSDPKKVIKFIDDKGSLFNRYFDYKKMIEHDMPDIVSICTPTQTHYQIVKDIVKYPIKAIFCEKPLSYTPQECREIIAYCKDADIILAVNYMRRWDNLYLRIKELMKELGELKSIVCYTNTALYMNASHMIDLIYMLCGNIETVYGKLDNSYVREVHGVKDPGGIFHFTTMNKAEGLLYAYCDDKIKHQFEIDLQFTNGRITSSEDGHRNSIAVYSSSLNRSNMKELIYNKINFIPNERMMGAIQDIVNVIEKKKYKVNCSGEDALKSVIFIKSCCDSEGEIVWVD